MLFCDYGNDLELFNSLMETIDDPAPMLDDDDNVVIRLESTSDEESVNGSSDDDKMPSEDPNVNHKDNKITGSLVSSAILESLNAGNKLSRDRRNRLFRAAYFATSYTKPFIIGTADAYTIRNDSKSTDFFKLVNDTTISVNFSSLVRMCTKKSFNNEIKAIGTDWNKATANTFNEFHEAIKKAAKKLTGFIDSGNTDVHADENKPVGQHTSKVNDKPTETQANDDMQVDDVNTPDENESDAKKLYSDILKDFRDNYQQELESDCYAEKDSIDDDGRQQLTDKYYDALMEPYADKADENTCDRVKKVIAYNVAKCTGKTNARNNSDDTGDDMNWLPNDSDDDTQKLDDDDDKSSDNNQNNQSWFKRTMRNWGDNGVVNNNLYVKPSLNKSDNKSNY